MTNLAFFYPAKIVFCAHPVQLEPILSNGHTFHLGPIGKQVYFSTDKGKPASKDAGDARQIFIEIEGHFCQLVSTRADNVQAWLEQMTPRILETLPTWKEQIKNPTLYEEQAAATREKIKTERAAQDAEQAEQKQRRVEAAEAAHKASVAAFSQGESIAWSDFERACKERGIVIPIRTLGMCRANVSHIAQKSMTTTGKRNSASLWQAVRRLSAALTA